MLGERQGLGDFHDAVARYGFARVALYCLSRLGDQHEQAAYVWDVARFSLHHKARACGVVNDIDYSLKLSELIKAADACRAIGEHAHGRAVDHQRGVAPLGKIAVGNLSLPAHYMGFDA